MNLIFRLIWMLITAKLGARRDIMAESRLTFRCLPSDLEMNMHMTNSRYHSFMDLARVAFMIRSGAWARVRAAGLAPVLGSSSIRFRQPVAPFQKFAVTCRTYPGTTAGSTLSTRSWPTAIPRQSPSSNALFSARTAAYRRTGSSR